VSRRPVPATLPVQLALDVPGLDAGGASVDPDGVDEGCGRDGAESGDAYSREGDRQAATRAL
jgi:hypothetical protein